MTATIHPVATQHETVLELLRGAKRHGGNVPIRRSFVQGGALRHPAPGPLAVFVSHHDTTGLRAYLLLMTLATAAPWDVRRHAGVWARALDLPSPGAVSKIWARLEQRNLIARQRVRRQASVTLLREDGSITPYERPGRPGGQKESYLRLPVEYWSEIWYQRLNLAETAMLLIGLSLKPAFALPSKQVPRWYGISEDTALDGLLGLERHGLLRHRTTARTAPLAPRGFTQERHYTLLPPFRTDWRDLPVDDAVTA